MIRVTDHIALDESEIREDFIRASGPGGQNVNKVATAVQLRFNAAESPSLPDDVRARLMRLAGKRLTEAGEIIIEAKRYRTQEQNREDALNRLVALIQKATERPKPRKKTRPTRASQQRRIEGKRIRGDTKRLRGKVRPDEH